MPVFGRRPDNALAERAQQFRARALTRARRARRELLVLTPLLAATLAAYTYRIEIFGADTPVRFATVGVLVMVGWAFARGLGRALGRSLTGDSIRGRRGFLASSCALARL